MAHAARACKIERDMHYRWMANDPEYPALFAEAKRKAGQSWEDEAVRRATEGVFEPNTHQGSFVYPIVGYMVDPKTGKYLENAIGGLFPIYGKKPLGVMKLSDRLLEFLLKGNKPEVYRDRGTVEITGAGGGPIEIVERLSAARARMKPVATPNESGS